MAGPDQISLTQSYVNGTAQKPLLGDTIGAHFDKTVARWGGHDALVVRHQDIRWTWGELQTDRKSVV